MHAKQTRLAFGRDISLYIDDNQAHVCIRLYHGERTTARYLAPRPPDDPRNQHLAHAVNRLASPWNAHPGQIRAWLGSVGIGFVYEERIYKENAR